MGVAMLMVMFFHHSSIADFGTIGNKVASYGEWGVDMFIFLSGYGIFHSLDKTGVTCASVVDFCKRRFRRIMPASLLAGWILGTCTMRYTDPDILPFQFMGLDKWYIRTILLLYLAAPLLYLTMKSRYAAWWVAAVLAGSLAYGGLVNRLSVEWLEPYRHFHLFRTLVVTVLKMPAFVLGMYVYVFLQQDRRISLLALVVLLGLSAVLTVVSCMGVPKAPSLSFCRQFFLSAFLALPLFCAVCFAFAKVFPLWLKTALIWVGCYSLEIYLMHERLFHVFGKSFDAPPALRVAVMFACSFVAAYLLKRVADLCVKGIQNTMIRFCHKG